MHGVAALSVARMLADGDDGGGESKKAGPIALAVILVLVVACYFLFRSMTRHLRKVREEFPADDAQPPQPPRPPADDAQPPADDQAEQPRARENGTADTPP